ncbi:Mu homology domain-containing protein [Lactifluus subvellereus]|nr:Mu homology domain-containing protein [Lactifluus subvellereus]
MHALLRLFLLPPHLFFLPAEQLPTPHPHIVLLLGCCVGQRSLVSELGHQHRLYALCNAAATMGTQIQDRRKLQILRTLTLTNVHTITKPSFHPCIRLNRFSQSKALSIVPPDGRFTLMEYRFSPPASKPGAAPALTATAAAQLQVQVPFILRSTLSITDHGGAFKLTFIPRISALDDVAVELYLGAGASSATCSQATGGSEWTYVPARRTLRWLLPPVAAQSSGGRGASAATTTTLQGTFVSMDAHPRPGSGGNDDNRSDSGDGASSLRKSSISVVSIACFLGKSGSVLTVDRSSNKMSAGVRAALVHIAREEGAMGEEEGVNGPPKRISEVGTLRLDVPVDHSSISPDGCTLLSVGDSPQVYLYGMTGGACITFTPLAQLTLPPFTSPPSVHPLHAVGTLPAPFCTAFSTSTLHPPLHALHHRSPGVFEFTFTPRPGRCRRWALPWCGCLERHVQLSDRWQ